MSHAQAVDADPLQGTMIVMLAWVVGALAARLGWLAAEPRIDQAFAAMADRPVEDDADLGARDALCWLAAGAAAAARITESEPPAVPPRVAALLSRHRRLLHAYLSVRGISGRSSVMCW